MPGRLLESARRRRSSVRTTISSIVVHTAIIVLAIRATAGAASAIMEPEVMIHIPLPQIAEPPAPPSSGSAPRSSAESPNTPLPAAPVFNAAIAVDIPPMPALNTILDATLRTAAGIGNNKPFGDGIPSGSGIGDGPGNGKNPGNGPGDSPFTGAEVDRQAYMIPGTMVPQYPELLRSSGIRGEVVAQFIVDTTEHVEPNSIVILSSTHPLFSAAVRTALLKGRFAPAESNGRKVRQLVQQAFTFTLQ